jgi:MFS family permease
VTRLGGYIRGLDPSLPRPVWMLETGVVVNAVGNGMILPFGMIYLHNVRGFSLGTAGLVIATFAAVTIVLTPLAGTLIDRLGARATLAGALVVSAVGYGLFPLIRHPWQGFLFMAIAGVGNGAFWPSQSTILAGLAGRERRSAAYAVQRTAFNLGIGIGGVVGGLIATTDHPRTFTVLFLADAATFLVYAAGVALVPSLREASAPVRGGGWAEVVRDRVFLRVIGLNVLFVIAGYAAWEVALPVLAKNHAGVGERSIGLIYLVNGITIVVAQLPVAKALEGRRRMRALAAMTAVWVVAWLVVWGGGLWLDAGAATAAFAVAAVIFGLGECALGPAQSALVADLAPDRLRGRYLSLLTSSYGVGLSVGPAAIGFLLGVSPLVVWPVAAGVLVVAGLGALSIERSLPLDVRITPVGAAAVEAHRKLS